MNEIIKKFLCKFFSEMHLTQTRFTYSRCGPFAKSKERIQKFKVNEDSRYLYQNKQDEACLQSYMPYWDFKDFPTMVFIIFWDYLMYYQIFFSPQVKWSTIISNKQCIYELPHESLNDLKLRILENYEKVRKISKLDRFIT